MSDLKFLHTADIHVGAANGYLGSLAGRRKRETVATFRKMAKHCEENCIPLMVIAGDLFDSNTVEASLISEVFDVFGEFPLLNFVFCAGNHDPLSSDSPFLNEKLPENVFVLGTQNDCVFFEKLKVKIYGCSFKSVFEDAFNGFNAADDDCFKIGVLHGEVGNSLSNYRYVNLDVFENSGLDYVALGHVHSASPVKKIGKTSYAYSGCPEGQGFDELGIKGAYEICLANETVKSKFVPFCLRQHVLNKIDISDCLSNQMVVSKVLSSLSENYGENYSDNLYKVELVGTLSKEFSLNLDSVLAGLSPMLFYVKLKNQTEKEFDFELIAKERTLRGIFVKKMLMKIEGAPKEEKANLRKALTLGLNAFDGEVEYDEN